jgi:hypothetical protein
LESLAARQGALEEELLTAPEERPETPPEWVQQLAVEEAEPTPVEGLGVSEVVAGEAAVSETIVGEGEVPVVLAEEPEGLGLAAGTAVLAGAVLRGKEEQQPVEKSYRSMRWKRLPSSRSDHPSERNPY